MTEFEQTAINYEYFANGWLKNVKRGTDLIASYEYDSVGNRTKVTYGNGSYQAYSYDNDPRYRVDNINYAYKCTSSDPITLNGGLDITRDFSGNPLTWGDSNSQYSKVYSYDSNSRLASANLPGSPQVNYGYDWVGNRINPGSYTYNAADQLTASPGKAYTYDNTGNLTQITGTGAKTFTYTANNLVSTVTSGTNTSTMVWNADGNRLQLTTPAGNTYKYIYDVTASVPAVVDEIQPSGSSILYVREPDGALIARIADGATKYYHFDELGSTIFMTDSNAVVTDKYTYDPWGNVTNHTGNTNQPYQFVGQLGYYTHYQDTNIPYIQTGVRLYNTEVGRYMQKDLIRYGINHMIYASNSPTTIIDPLGLFDLENPEYVKMIKTYICQTGCLIDLLGIPWESAWNQDIWGIIQDKGPSKINDLLNIIVKYVEKKGHRKLIRRTLEQMGREIKSRKLNKATKCMKTFTKIAGKLIMIYDLGKAATFTWKCVDDNYGIF